MGHYTRAIFGNGVCQMGDRQQNAQENFVSQHSHLGWLGEERLAHIGAALGELEGEEGVAGELAALITGALLELRSGDRVWLAGRPELRRALETRLCRGSEAGAALVESWPEGCSGQAVTVVFAGAEEAFCAETLLAIRESAREKLSAVFLVEVPGERLATQVLLSELGPEVLPRIVVDAGDVFAVLRVMQEATAHGRRGQGPTLVVAAHFLREP